MFPTPWRNWAELSDVHAKPLSFANQGFELPADMKLLPLALAAYIFTAYANPHHGWKREVEPTDDEIRCEIGRDSCAGHAVNGHVSGGMATCTKEYSM